MEPDQKGCVLCGLGIPVNAERCHRCSAYQDWRKHLILTAALTSAFTLIAAAVTTIKPAAAYISDIDSHTKFKLVRAAGDPARIDEAGHSEAALLYLNVWNTGRKPSAMVGYRLKLGASPVHNLTFEDVPLERFPDDTIVIQEGGKPVLIRLRVRELELIQRGCRPYKKHEVIALLGNEDLRKWRVTLEVEVEESNDPREAQYWNKIPPRPFHKRTDTFPIESIAKFLEGSMSG